MKPYNEEEGKKEQVRDMFDNIARRYDRLNRIISLGIDNSWRRRVVKEVAGSGAARVLDVATGTGDLAIMLARKCRQARITGLDISKKMLEIGRRKVEGAGLSQRIVLEAGDAEDMPFGDGAFDAVTAAFGVRNFGDIGKGVGEIYRVLGNNGTVYILEFGIPRMKIFSHIYRFYFHRVLPAVGRIVSGDGRAYTYLPLSVEEFPYGAPFVAILEAAGFTDCRIINMSGGIAQIYHARKRER